MGDITLLDNRTNIPNITIVYSDNIPIYQWEISRIQFMEVRKRTIFLAIYCGDIPWNLALKNRPKIYGIGTSNQSIPSRCGAFVFFLVAYPLRKSSISWTTVVPWTCWTSRLPRKNHGCEWMVSRDIYCILSTIVISICLWTLMGFINQLAVTCLMAGKSAMELSVGVWCWPCSHLPATIQKHENHRMRLCKFAGKPLTAIPHGGFLRTRWCPPVMFVGL